MTGPLGVGGDGQSPWQPYPYLLLTPTLVREVLGEVKWEYWRVSRDDNFHFKVDGIKLFPFHVATGERWGWSNFPFFKRLQWGLRSQRGLNAYFQPSFPSKLMHFRSRLPWHKIMWIFSTQTETLIVQKSLSNQCLLHVMQQHHKQHPPNDKNLKSLKTTFTLYLLTCMCYSREIACTVNVNIWINSHS